MDQQAQARRITDALSASGVSLDEVWLGYYSIGGRASRVELEAFIRGSLELSMTECDVLGEAVNQLLAEAAGGSAPLIPPCTPDDADVAQESPTDSRRGLGVAGAFLFTEEEQEQERCDAVVRTGLLDTAGEERFDRITREAKEFFHTGSSSITLIDDHRQFLKSATGHTRQNLPRESTFCNVTIRSAGPLIVRDALEDDRFRDNPLVIGAPHTRFYAGYPVRGPGGWTVGTLCVMDKSPREFSSRDGKKLRSLARAVESEINGPSVAPDVA
ncbi:GAF domain-containing protein [Arthrobacter echini]|uniref:GAF domain-containing protein n=1 Tax=Arthrobacter echini TaxID=1529066 RepID=A0A4S5E9R5_9MICC|nr:GAF domain-containing protein [Arthrobacter echini]THJ68467.1 GAF domain-containing protein [Arthrobacter echini]